MKRTPLYKPTTLAPTLNRPLQILAAVVRAFDAKGDYTPAANYARALLSERF